MIFLYLAILIVKEVIIIRIDDINTNLKIYQEEGEYDDNQTTDDDDTYLSFEDESSIITDNVYEVTSETKVDLNNNKKEGE